MLEAIWQGVLNGFALGWIYILMALGLTLIFSIMNIVQLAHGELYMLGAYFAYYLAMTRGINLFGSIVITVIGMAGVGIFLERVFFRRLQGNFMGAILLSTALTLFLQSGTSTWFGVYERSIPRLAKGSLEIIGSAIPADRSIAVVIAVILVVLLYFFLKGTKQGKALVASAQNREGAILSGIDANRMSSLAMAIGCALAACGGILAGALFVVSPMMGTIPLMKGLIIIIVGGLGSLLGSVIAGMALGLIDGIVPILLNPAVAVLFPLVIVIVFLIVRPQGIFGHE